MNENIIRARSKVAPTITKNSKINSEGLGVSTSDGYMIGDNLKANVLGKTTHNFATGRSDILYSTKAASNYSILGRVMSHETAHAYSFAYGFPKLDIDKLRSFDSTLDNVEHLTIRELEYTYAAKNIVWANMKNGYTLMSDIKMTKELLQPAQKFLYNFLYKQFSPIFNTNYLYP